MKKRSNSLLLRTGRQHRASATVIQARRRTTRYASRKGVLYQSITLTGNRACHSTAGNPATKQYQ